MYVRCLRAYFGAVAKKNCKKCNHYLRRLFLSVCLFPYKYLKEKFPRNGKRKHDNVGFNRKELEDFNCGCNRKGLREKLQTFVDKVSLD